MLNKFFAHKYSGGIIVLLYGVAGLCWFSSFRSGHYRLILLVAAAFLVAGFFASLGWVWRNPRFRSVRTVYTRRYSDQQLYRHSDIVSHEYTKIYPDRRSFGVRPRKGKKSLRRTLTACFAGLSVVGLLGMVLTMKAPRPVNNRARLDIYLSDGVELRTRVAPALPRSVQSRSLVFALANVPMKEVRIHHSDTSATIQVVLRNMSAAEIKNARVEISSNGPIVPADGSTIALSKNEMGSHTGVITPYSQTKEEHVIKVNVAIPRPLTAVGLYVTVSGENVQPVGGVEKINFAEIPDGGAATVTERAKMSRASTAVR